VCLLVGARAAFFEFMPKIYRKLILFFVAFGYAFCAIANEANSAKGSLVIVGGALRADNAPVYERIVSLAGGAGALIAVFPTAAGNPQSAGERAVALFERYGARAFVVPIAPKLAGSDAAMASKAAHDPALIAKLANAGGVFFTGGDQSRITQALLKSDGTQTPVLQAVWALYRAGGVIAGTSAGAAIMSQQMFYEPPEVLVSLQRGAAGQQQGRDIAPGLGFIGAGVLVDQHFLARGRFARALPAMVNLGLPLGLGVDENTALVVTNAPERSVEVIGTSGAVLLDLRSARHDPKRSGFALSGAKLSLLASGDRVALPSGVVTPSAPKLKSSLLDPNAASYRPEHNESRFYSDPLGKGVLAEVMSYLIDNKAPTATALAFGSPSSALAEQGFEMVFRKGADTRGYFTSAQGTEDYTVLNIALDIEPVELARPLYKTR
jgi:cyanophycinase